MLINTKCSLRSEATLPVCALCDADNAPNTHDRLFKGDCSCTSKAFTAINNMRNTSDLLAVQCSCNQAYLASEERQNLHQDYAVRN